MYSDIERKIVWVHIHYSTSTNKMKRILSRSQIKISDKNFLEHIIICTLVLAYTLCADMYLHSTNIYIMS